MLQFFVNDDLFCCCIFTDYGDAASELCSSTRSKLVVRAGLGLCKCGGKSEPWSALMNTAPMRRRHNL
jgi:hypothetical protein